jgi:hypothetical protein
MTRTAHHPTEADIPLMPHPTRCLLPESLFRWSASRGWPHATRWACTVRVITLAPYPWFGPHWRKEGDEARLNRGQRSPLMASTPPLCDRARRRLVEEVTLSHDP